MIAPAESTLRFKILHLCIVHTLFIPRIHIQTDSSAPTLIFSFSAVLGKCTPFLYGRYEVTEALERLSAFAVERMEVL